jgi:di/tricarboxylate transporter
MTLPQIEAIAIVLSMLVLFVSDRLRYDLVAGLALSAGLITGVIPHDKAFDGFSSPVIIIIAAVLVISRAVAVSGVIDSAMRPVLRYLHSTTMQIGSLTAAVTFISAFVKNVGALGVFMPIAIQTADHSKRPVSRYLMPLAFGSLIGGTMTQIGTSPNILISEVRQQVLGQPYHLFSFTLIGLPLSLLAIGFLSVGWRLLPDKDGDTSGERRFAIEDYTCEALLPEDSPMVGQCVGDFEKLGDVVIVAVVRGTDYYFDPGWRRKLLAGDILMLQGDSTVIQPVVHEAKLQLLGADEISQLKPVDKDDHFETVEAVVAPNSGLIGHSPADLNLRQAYEVNLLAISREQRMPRRLRVDQFASGDILLLQGRQIPLAHAMTEFHLLPLAERNLTIGRPRWRYLPIIILVLAMVAIAAHLIAVEAGFFIAALLMVLAGQVNPKEAYSAIEWPIIFMLGCLIPVGEALHDTGVSALMANGLTTVAGMVPPWLAVGMMLVVTMLVTPLLHHAAAVLVMGPVAAALAKNLGAAPDAFLMAVAFGAACDFLTPIGHQNTTLVMRPGGYRFSDYWRLGLPLSVLVAIVGTGLILLVYPLAK